MSIALPKPDQQVIASFYDTLFGSNTQLVEPRLPFEFGIATDFAKYDRVNDEAEYKQAVALLKEKLGASGVKVPVLYKQYVELCEPVGASFGIQYRSAIFKLCRCADSGAYRCH